jgi:phytoene dehydrogenase-like protein
VRVVGGGGIHRLATALAQRLRALGGSLRFDTRVDALLLSGRRACGVSSAAGPIDADAVVWCGDALELGTGAVRGAIYGAAPHGRLGTLRRPGPVVRGVDGLCRAGETAHPGGGLPLVALSGRIVADLIGPAS